MEDINNQIEVVGGHPNTMKLDKKKPNILIK